MIPLNRTKRKHPQKTAQRVSVSTMRPRPPRTSSFESQRHRQGDTSIINISTASTHHKHATLSPNARQERDCTLPPRCEGQSETIIDVYGFTGRDGKGDDDDCWEFQDF